MSTRFGMLRVIQKLSLSDQVFDQLAHKIISGEYVAGAQLPPERALVQVFEVNRHVVREALKRLEQLGLVSIAQGGGTTVLDFQRTAGLDVAALLSENAQAAEVGLWFAALEMAAALAPDAARLCAMRADRELKQSLVELAQKMKRQADGPELFTLDLQFWDHVVDGSGNILYRLANNSLVKAYLAPASIELVRGWSIEEVKKTGYRVALATAIARGDARRAESKAREAMTTMAASLPKRAAVTSTKRKKSATSRTRRK
jgi:GntR family transcriptional regulator, transcriptional repressor for pyruvate dehydrogenase complex